MKSILKVGVAGVGHLGKIHLKLLKELIDEYEVVGFYDTDPSTAEKVEEEYDVPFFSRIEDLIPLCDVIDIITPTLSHAEIATKAIRQCKHVFIEKPITNTLDEAKALIALSHEAEVKVQVGHVERFNPAFTAAKDQIESPMFIETHRLAQFNPRGTDVPVVLDLMIHDLDIILSVVKSNIKRISASGVAVVSDTPDITNARIEFDNGCVANLTASRISMKNMRKSRFFQKDAYISVDFLEKKSEVVRMTEQLSDDPFAMVLDLGEKGKREIIFSQPEVEPVNAIKEELRSFAHAINNNSAPPVTIEDGYHALEVAHKIMDKIRMANGTLSSTQ